jgi:hypothetical protein
VDGKLVGLTPFPQGIVVDPGQHALRISAVGFKPLLIDISVASGAEVPVSARLATVEAWLRVDCVGAGAVVRLDGKVAGDCPFEGEVQAGTHQVSVHAEGIPPFEKTITIDPGAEITLSVDLATAQTDGPGEPGGGERTGVFKAGVALTVVGAGVGVLGLVFNVKGTKDEESALAAAPGSKDRDNLNADIRVDKAMMIAGYAGAGVLIATGIVMMAVSGKSKEKSDGPVAVKPAAGGLALEF